MKKLTSSTVSPLRSTSSRVFCDLISKASYNFLALAASGYYDNTLFHRNMKGFMLQGGDPTGTGKGTFLFASLNKQSASW